MGAAAGLSSWQKREMTARSNSETLITIYGGSGFLGRHLVRALARRGYRIRVAVRRPELAGHLQPLGLVGQINAVQANIRNTASVEAAARGADVLINLVGILFERGRQRFDAVHTVALAELAAGRTIAQVVGKLESLGIDLKVIIQGLETLPKDGPPRTSGELEQQIAELKRIQAEMDSGQLMMLRRPHPPRHRP